MSTESHTRTGRDDRGRLVVRSHAGAVGVAEDPETFSSAVSRHLQIPNGLDGAAHRAARDLIDPFFTPPEIDALVPGFTSIARDLVGSFGDGVFDAVSELGARFAVRAQSRWLGWDARYEDELLAWVDSNRAASRSTHPQQTADVAARFDDLIVRLLDERRARPADDATQRLLRLRRADGSGLDDAELVSVLRNWTAGDLSSIALCVGVVAHWLAVNPRHQPHLRDAGDAELDAAIDEILRADDPFVSNRRVATRDAAVDGCPVGPGDVVVIDWREANVDPTAFPDPGGFDPFGNAARNLVYGIGPHVCPGRPLATAELRVVARALLAGGTLSLAGEPTRETAPIAGFRTVPVRLAPVDD